MNLNEQFNGPPFHMEETVLGGDWTYTHPTLDSYLEEYRQFNIEKGLPHRLPLYGGIFLARASDWLNQEDRSREVQEAINNKLTTFNISVGPANTRPAGMGYRAYPWSKIPPQAKRVPEDIKKILDV